MKHHETILEFWQPLIFLDILSKTPGPNQLVSAPVAYLETGPNLDSHFDLPQVAPHPQGSRCCLPGAKANPNPGSGIWHHLAFYGFSPVADDTAESAVSNEGEKSRRLTATAGSWHTGLADPKPKSLYIYVYPCEFQIPILS